MSETEVAELLGKLSSLESEIGKVILGQNTVVGHLLVALMASGHCLLEGVPGLAKTLMVRTLGQALHLSFKRIQFTPDLMPSDIVGTEILADAEAGERAFRFHRGPIFANLVLADEINRSPPKTQSALLEAMQEYEVTYGGRTYPLDRPFFVLATQNPIEQTGTYPLPEAQLDRFLLQLRVGYPDIETEVGILESTTGDHAPEVQPIMTGEEVLRLQSLVRQVHASRALVEWTAALVRATRPTSADGASTVPEVNDFVEWGAGPRAGQSLILAAKARALLAGRFSVVEDDLVDVVPAVLRHRLVVNYRGQAERVTPDRIAESVVSATPRPPAPLA
ncbi:MAG: AAA family ATPase [Thermoanaerobaculia bacterium]